MRGGTHVRSAPPLAVAALAAALRRADAANHERATLVALYEATGGARWIWNGGWLNSSEPCSGSTANWFGLAFYRPHFAFPPGCTPDGHVGGLCAHTDLARTSACDASF